MDELRITRVPAMETGMLIRRPVAEVFEAFVDPGITKRWVERHERIEIEWPGAGGRNRVEWRFSPRGEGTWVEIRNDGFTGSGDEVVKQALESTGGFTLVLAGAKALLEHGVRLNLVGDRFPEGIVDG